MTSAGHQQLGPLKEGDSVDIECQLNETGSLTIWFRVLDKAGLEFIASFSNNVHKNTESKPSSSFTYGKIRSHKVTLASFSRERDSGLYSCAALIKGKELKFGTLSRLFGGESADSLAGDRKEAFAPNPACPLRRTRPGDTHRRPHHFESPGAHARSGVHVRQQRGLL